MKKITLLIALFCFSIGFSQTFTDNTIHDLQNGNGSTALTCGTADELNLPLTVSGITGNLGSGTSIESVTLNITHSWNADVVLSLQDPSGATTVLLVDDIGGSGDGFSACVLQDGNPALPAANTTPVTGTFSPLEALGVFNAGTSPNGDWVLIACDDANGDVGTIDSWSITFAPTPACVPATFSLADGGNNCPADEFLIDVDIIVLGTAATVNILNDGGAPAINGIDGTSSPYTVGPFTAGTDVTITIEDAADATCNATNNLTIGNCPPTNDDCANAIALTPGAMFTTNPIGGQTNASATDSGELPLPGCAVYDPVDPTGNGGDVWYSVVVPPDGNITLETAADPTGSGGDPGAAVYSGSCGALTLIECDDDDGDDGAHSKVVVSDALLAGQTIYFRVWELGGNDIINFQVSAHSPTLSIGESAFEAFKYFPNPVTNELTLSAQNNIQNVTVYNMLGQEVLRIIPNSIESKVDMNGLSDGAYFVKVTINNSTETIRIIKN